MPIFLERLGSLSGRVIAREERVVGRVVAQYRFRDSNFVYFGGSVHHPQLRDVRPHSHEWRLVRAAQTAVQMHGARDDFHQYLWCRSFDGCNFLADLPVIFLVLVDQPRGIEHVQAVLHHHGVGVGDLFLGHLFIREQLALGAPAQGPFAHHVQRFADDADGSHGMVHATATLAGFARRENPGPRCPAGSQRGRDSL